MHVRFQTESMESVNETKNKTEQNLFTCIITCPYYIVLQIFSMKFQVCVQNRPDVLHFILNQFPVSLYKRYRLNKFPVFPEVIAILWQYEIVNNHTLLSLWIKLVLLLCMKWNSI